MSMSHASSLDSIPLPKATHLAIDNNVDFETDQPENQVSSRTRASLGNLTTPERNESHAASKESNRWENAGLVSFFAGAACFIAGLILTTYALPLLIAASVLFLIATAFLAKSHYVDKANEPAFNANDLHRGDTEGGTGFELGMNQIARDSRSGIDVLDNLCEGTSVSELRAQVHEQLQLELDGNRLEHYQLVRSLRTIQREVAGPNQSILFAVHEAILLHGICERRNITPDARLQQEINAIKNSCYSEIVFESNDESATETRIIDQSELNFSSLTSSEYSDLNSIMSAQFNVRRLSPNNLQTPHKFAPTPLPFSPRECDEFETDDSTRSSYDSASSTGSLILDLQDLADIRLDFMTGSHLQDVCTQIRECTFDVVVDADSFQGTSVSELRIQLDNYINETPSNSPFGRKFADFNRLLNNPVFDNHDEDVRSQMRTVLKVFILQKLCEEKGLGLPGAELSDSRLSEEYQAIQSSGLEELILVSPSQKEDDSSSDFTPTRSESDTWD